MSYCRSRMSPGAPVAVGGWLDTLWKATRGPFFTVREMTADEEEKAKPVKLPTPPALPGDEEAAKEPKAGKPWWQEPYVLVGAGVGLYLLMKRRRR